MKTNIAKKYHNHTEIQEAESILRACVHCGFCTATCPTYQELCDERDGPRGRIYLIKQLLEGGTVTDKTQTHLDRCLTCRSCETTCPSGVKYGRLIDIARGVMEESHPRSSIEIQKRKMLRKVLPNAARFATLLKVGQFLRPLMPSSLKEKIPQKATSSPWPKGVHSRKMIVLEGCAQPSATPNTNAAAARVLDKLDISLVVAPEAGCCGAVSYHLGAHDEGLDYMRQNIDAWWPAIENGAEAIMISASGCGATVKEYGHLLRLDPKYAEKAQKVSELAKDISEIILAEDTNALAVQKSAERIALHIPCSLQHGLGLPDHVEKIFTNAGFELTKTKEKHLCCGSAGTYSILQPEMSKKLRTRKLEALTGDSPDVIVTANIGCQLHLEGGSSVPVRHWIELLDQACT